MVLFNKSNIKISVLLFISIFSSFIALKLSYYIAENYLFDKFFYQKSINHGYFPNREVDLSIFGDRSKDLINQHPPRQDEYTIAIIGDSYTWGMGIKNKQRFVTILQARLQEIRPTRIISLAKPSWNILQYV